MGAQGYSSNPTKPESPNYVNVEKRLTKLFECLHGLQSEKKDQEKIV